jgi:AcrR family transcriptional regulator
MPSTRHRPGGRPHALRRRLAPGDRRRDLVRVAAGLLTTRGVDAVQIADVAAAGGVSRQLVYKFFPSRQAIIKAVLEDFADALTAEFGRHALDRLPAGLAEATQVFVEAACDTIEAQGAGAWHLLDSKGPDHDVARLGRAIMDRLVAPWPARIAAVTGTGEREATVVARMVVAAGRAVLDLWCAGEISRREAVRYATLGMTALLETFPNGTGRLRARRSNAAPGRRRRDAAV